MKAANSLLKMLYTVIAFTLLFTTQVRPEDSQVRLVNSKLAAEISVRNHSLAITALESFRAPQSLTDTKILQLSCGRKPSNAKNQDQWQLLRSSETEAEFSGKIHSCGTSVNIQFRVQDTELMIDYQVTPLSGTVEFPEGLSLNMGSEYSGVTYANHTFQGFGYDFEQEERHISLMQSITLHHESMDLCVFLPNPYKSFWKFRKKDHEAIFEIFPILPASSIDSEEASWSNLRQEDTLEFAMSLSPYRYQENYVYISEHPHTWNQALTMYYDELPNRDDWNVMTTGDAEDLEFYHFFVRLLEEFPDMKIGLVMLADRILSREPSTWDGWSTQSPFIIPDTLSHSEGEASVYFHKDQGVLELNSDTLDLTSGQYTLSFRYKGDQGVIQVGPHQFPLAPRQSWTDTSLSFFLDSMQNTLKIQSNGSSELWIDDVDLENSGVNLLQNPGFENYQAAYMYDNERRHWTDAHGPEYLVNAPQPYLDFLKRLETSELKYGWEDRVSIGCHGYHHTPNVTEPDPAHEFNYFDPVGDSLRLHRIYTDIQQIGLTKQTLRYWRNPGLRHTRSMIHPAIDSGMVWTDPGWWWQDNPNRYFFLQRNGKTLWGNALSWWSDHTASNSRYEKSGLYKSLDEGHLAHMGGHPEPTFHYKDIDYRQIKELFIELEEKYPHMGYVFPDEYADYASAVSKLRLRKEQIGDTIILKIEGDIPDGFTLIFHGDYTEDDIYRILPTSIYGNYTIRKDTHRLFVALPNSRQEERRKNLQVSYSLFKVREIFNLKGEQMWTHTRTEELTPPSFSESEVLIEQRQSEFNKKHQKLPLNYSQ